MTNNKIAVPPLKIQGIKTKLIPLISQYAVLNNSTTWIEPFMGSGVVGFNIAPKNAIFADTNPHIIDFYTQIQKGVITPYSVRSYLEQEGQKLKKGDTAYYIEVRNRFNENHDPLDFLFLNRSCFNGMMRFNKNNDFNVPYGHKPERFAKAYITKIVNQVSYISEKLKNNNWQFICQSFDKTLSLADSDSFVYCDPPYIGRNVDYYDSWDETLELSLCNHLKECGAKFILSTWDHNDYRSNGYIDTIWSFCHKIQQKHFYHVGAKESNRNAIVEALLMNYDPIPLSNKAIYSDEQVSIFDTQT